MVAASPRPQSFSITTAIDAVASLFDIKEGFRKGYVFELRNTQQPAPLQVHVLVLNPRRYTLSEPFQVTLTPTEDNSVVAEETGYIIREIIIEGTMGLSDKKATGFEGVQFGGSAVSGSEHFSNLREMFRCYSELKKDPRTAPFTRMVFHSLRDDDHFLVVPRSFETPRDARTTRMHYDYRIALAVIGDAANTLVPVVSDEGFDFFSDELQAISSAFNDARAAFAEITANIAAIKRKVGNIEAVMLQAAGLINAVGNMLKAGGALIAYPFQLVASTLETVDRAQDNLAQSFNDFAPIPDVGGQPRGQTSADIQHAMRRMSAAIDRLAVHPQRFGSDTRERTSAAYKRELALTDDDLENATGGASIGSKTRITVGSEADAGLDLSAYRGYTRVRVFRTTTIEGLAFQFDVPAELIILINDLRFPYIAEGGGPGILKPGDFILIPLREGVTPTGAGVAPGDENLTIDDALYGVDLALDPVELDKGRFELLEDTVRSFQDALLIHGLENVVQGTSITILTERGTTVYVPEVGIRRNVGIRGTLQHVLLAALNLREAILLDPRIEGIQDSSVVLDGDVLTQEISPIVTGQKEAVTLILPFGKATGLGGG